MEGYERLKSVGGGGRYDALATDGRTTYPGVGVSFGVSRTLVPLLADGVLDAQPLGAAAPCWSRCADEESRERQRRGRPAAAGARHRRRGRRRAPQKYGKQIRYAERRGIPFVWFPASRTRRARGQGHPLRRPGRRPIPQHLDARRPPTSARSIDHHDRRPARREPHVIRTHDAGTLRAEHVGQTVTLAGWVARRRDHGGVAFLDLREASGVVQVVVRDEAVAHSLRSEYCLKVTGEVGRAPRGQREPRPADRRDRGRRHRRRGAQRRARRCRSRSTTHVEVVARRRGSSTATSTCAAPGPPRRSGCAARSTRPPATCWTTTTSSRSRPRR